MWGRRGAIVAAATVAVVCLAAAFQLSAREKDTTPYGAGLIVNVPFPEQEVLQVIHDVAQNSIIRGTKEYNKDEFVSGAAVADSTKVFSDWTEGGKVFYKVKLKALDPRNFKDSNDVGTLAVRYVVQPQDDTHTILRIDARFVEDFRHTVHLSNGSVESAEYKDIHDQLDAMELSKVQAIDAQNEQLRQKAANERPNFMDEPRGSNAQPGDAASAAPAWPAQKADASPPQTLEQRIAHLREQVERRVKAPGAPLKSAPFHTASTLQSLPAGTEVLIVISTPYWFGVETHEGQHGWMSRDELEFVP